MTSAFFTALPLIVLVTAALRFRRAGWGVRRSALAGAVVWAVLLVGITELLSLFGALDRAHLALAWAAAGGVLTWPWLRRTTTDKIASPKGPAIQIKPPSWESRFLLAGVGLILTGTLVTAIVAAPNNWDSLTYHLPRIEHWIQNESIAHYPTHNLRQLFFTPLAEWIVLHFQLLAGGDRLANSIQWLCFVGVVIGVSLLAQQLGAGRGGQILAAVFVATIPMTILQATSTQNDLVAAFWLVCSLVFLLPMRRGFNLPGFFLCAAACGLLALTKTTGALSLLPFIGWAGVRAMRETPQKKLRLLAWVLAFVAFSAVLNSGHWLRNLNLFDHPLGPAGQRVQYVNASPSAKVLISNTMRNVAVFTQTPWSTVNDRIYGAFVALHRALRIDPNLPETAFRDLPFKPGNRWREENNAGAPWHVVLIVVSLFLLIQQTIRGQPGLLPPYATALILAFLLYSLVIRWQPTQVRLLLPQLILWAPLVGTLFAGRRTRLLATGLFLALELAAMPAVLANELRPLVGKDNIFETHRFDQLFNGLPHARDHYRGQVEQLIERRCWRIGLRTRDGSFEYPLWAMMRSEAPHLRIQHVRVKNRSAGLKQNHPAFRPCAVMRIFGGVNRNRLHFFE